MEKTLLPSIGLQTRRFTTQRNMAETLSVTSESLTLRPRLHVNRNEGFPNQEGYRRKSRRRFARTIFGITSRGALKTTLFSMWLT